MRLTAPLLGVRARGSPKILTLGKAVLQHRAVHRQRSHRHLEVAASTVFHRSSIASPVFLLSVFSVISTGIANRLFYKMALIPLGDHIFFLAQLQTFGYILVYFGILWARVRSGRIPLQLLQIPRSKKKTFLSIGLVEAIASLLGLYSAARLPGVLLPILSQAVLFYQVLFAVGLQGKRLAFSQVFGVIFVIAGVITAAWPSGPISTSVLAGVDKLYVLIFVVSMLFPALDTIFKENLFKEVRMETGKDLDLFIVNSFGSLSQGAFILLSLPLLTSAAGLTMSELPRYLHQGWLAFTGGAPGAPMLPLLYVIFNLAFNIAALNLVRIAGNVTMSLVMSLIVPFTLYAFTLQLPFLPAPPPLSSKFLAGVAIMVSGMLLYNAPLWMPTLKHKLNKKLVEWVETG